MILKTNKKELKKLDWNQIETEINNLGSKNCGYLILENDNGDYIQCAGDSEMLTVEYRIHTKSKFKHYVIGKGENKSPLKVNWVFLQTDAGGIMIHKEEVLNLKEANLIFKAFFEKQIIPTELNKRNVTKLHL